MGIFKNDKKKKQQEEFEAFIKAQNEREAQVMAEQILQGKIADSPENREKAGKYLEEIQVNKISEAYSDNTASVADELLKLKKLLDLKVLTQEEFDLMKKSLLNPQKPQEKKEAVSVSPIIVNNPENDNEKDYFAQRRLIKNGGMCPKCKSQDVMVTNTKKKISGVLMVGIAAKNHAQMVCKNCGKTWKL